MAARPLMMTGLLGAAVGVPYAVHEAPKWSIPAFASASQGASANAPLPGGPVGPGSLLYENTAPLEGVGAASLGEVLRLDVTREWVYSRWARKSAGLSDPTLFGVRVPLVTGPAVTDVAGSLTYYFNQNGQCDRITFHGRTGDTSPLVAVAQQQFGMQRQAAPPGEQIYQVRTNRGVESQLHTRSDPVLWSTAPHGSFSVDLQVNRPGTGRLVETATPRLVLPPAPAVAAAPPPTAAAPQATAPQGVGPDGGAPGGAAGPRVGKAQRPEFRWPN